jgi:hypothetical protein
VALPLGLPLPDPSPIFLAAHSDLGEVPRIRIVWDYLVELTTKYGESLGLIRSD